MPRLAPPPARARRCCPPRCTTPASRRQRPSAAEAAAALHRAANVAAICTAVAPANGCVSHHSGCRLRAAQAPTAASHGRSPPGRNRPSPPVPVRREGQGRPRPRGSASPAATHGRAQAAARRPRPPHPAPAPPLLLTPTRPTLAQPLPSGAPVTANGLQSRPASLCTPPLARLRQPQRPGRYSLQVASRFCCEQYER